MLLDRLTQMFSGVVAPCRQWPGRTPARKSLSILAGSRFVEESNPRFLWQNNVKGGRARLLDRQSNQQELLYTIRPQMSIPQIKKLSGEPGTSVTGARSA